MTIHISSSILLTICVVCFVAVFADVIPKMIAVVFCAALAVLLIALSMEVSAVAIFVTFIVGSVVLLFALPAGRDA